MIFLDIQGRAPEVCEQPLVAIAAGEVDALVVEVDRERPEGLNRVGVQIRSVVVSELGERGQVVAIPVSVRDPSHRQQARSFVDASREVFHRHPAAFRRHDAKLDTRTLLELTV